MGERFPLDLSLFRDEEKMKAIRESKLKQKNGA